MITKRAAGGSCCRCRPSSGGFACAPCTLPEALDLDITIYPSDRLFEDLDVPLEEVSCHFSGPMTLVDAPLYYVGSKVADRFWRAAGLCKRWHTIGLCPDPLRFDYRHPYVYREVVVCCPSHGASVPGLDATSWGRITLIYGGSGNESSDSYHANCNDPDLGSCDACGGAESAMVEVGSDGTWEFTIQPAWVISADDVGEPPEHPGGDVCSCAPLDIEFTPFGYVGIEGFVARLREASAAPGPCQIDPPPCEDGCWARVTYIDQCPETCTEGTFSVYDPVDDVTYGPFNWQVTLDPEGGCLARRATARVCAPAGSSGSASPSRDFEFVDHTAGDAVVATITVTGCADATVVEGDNPGVGKIKICVTGCPDGEPLHSVPVGLTILDGGGLAIGTGAAGTDLDGCAIIEVPFPDDAGAYDITVHIDPPYDGYKASFTTLSDVELPAAAASCNVIEVEGGTIAAAIHDDWVCTCGGPAPRCLTCSGNEDPIELTYDDGNDQWEGTEILPPQANGCALNPDPTAQIAVTLTVEEVEGVCTWKADRITPTCFTVGGSPCPGTVSAWLEAALGGEVNFSPSKAEDTPAVWGPTGTFPVLGFNPWTKPDGTTDTDHCSAPSEAYTATTAVPCSGGGGFAAMMAPPPADQSGIPDSEPPLPPLRRQVAGFVRTAARVAYRAAKGGGIKASQAEQARRWAICKGCSHFRASDRRCGKRTGCACWLDRAIPYAAKECPVGKWAAEAVNG